MDHDFIPGLDKVEEPSAEHEVGPAHEVAGSGARHQADDQRSVDGLRAEAEEVRLLPPPRNPINFI